MYNGGSTEFNNLIERPGGNALITRLTFADFKIENLTKLEYYGGSNNSDDIAIGTTNMAYLDASAITDKVITNQEFLFEVGMELSDGTIEYAPMGYFTVQKPDVDENVVNFKAYDRMQKFEKPYFSALTYPTDSAKVLNELCTMCGVELATLITNPITITDKLDGYTCREVLGYIAGIHGFFACFDRYGKLNLRWYSETPIEKQIGLIWSLTKAQSNYRVEKITLAKDNETTYTSGEGISGINHSNPYATQGIADSIYARLNGFTYRPCEISMLDDIRLDPWDMLKVTYLDGSVLTIPVMSLSHSFTNGETKVKSFGKSDTENEYSYSGPVTQAMNRMATELLIANRIIATKVSTSELSAEVAKLGYMTAEQAEISYAKIDFSNVGTQVVSSSMIIDGAVTNEKVANLSANKITSGTIDASKINVTNLNADNLTVGTINGQRIGKGSLSLDKLSEEVPTKEYLDSVEESLQNQIDGAIETFTKTEIPTLNNEPASSWTDNETRKKHIGDICYVVNPTSSADGYCYRFANVGSESSPSYSWVLIKDSDVTKALQDIIDINGEITGIKQFDNEISSWKTDTDNELSSIKARTSTLETEMGTKVESSVFNEVKQTVDENSSNITSLSTTVSKKADSSTVTALTNTVNSVKQTVDTNTSSISSMQTEITKKADGSTVTALTNRVSTVEQNLDGFKTTVSQTYTTKEEFNGLEIGGRNLFLSSKNLNKFENASPSFLTLTRTNDTATIKVKTASQGNYGLIFDIPCENLEQNTDYIFSIYVNDYYNLNQYPHFSIGSSDTYVWNGITGKYIQIDKGYNSVTFNTEEHTGYFRFFVGIYLGNVDSYLTVSNAKLEKGNKATDWTPALEDTEASITAVETIATQTADKFNWLVKSGTSATDFTLTDRTATLISEYINLNGLVTFSGLSSSAVSSITDTIEIGSRNYFSSKKQNAFDENNEYRLNDYRNQGSFTQFYNLTVPMSYFVGKNCKLSFDVISPNGDTAFQVYNDNGKPRYLMEMITISSIGTTWTHQELTITVTDRGSSYDEHYSNKIEFYALSQMGCKIRNVKLEIGNKATDWTPAPEDISVENVYTPNTTTIDGGKITTGSIKAAQIDVDNLFAQNITATNFNMTGGTINLRTDSETADVIKLQYLDDSIIINPNKITMRGSDGNNLNIITPLSIQIKDAEAGVSSMTPQGIATSGTITVKSQNIATYVDVVEVYHTCINGVNYQDVAWNCPEGYKIVHVTPVFVDDWSKNWSPLILVPQEINNTGCKLVVNSTVARTVFVRINLTFRAIDN